MISQTWLLKKVAPEIAKQLAMVFNCSIKTGVIPEQLKIAKVIPIYKKRWCWSTF